MLLYKEVRVFCLKVKISITTEPIEFSILLYPWMVLGYFPTFFIPSNTEFLDALGAQ